MRGRVSDGMAGKRSVQEARREMTDILGRLNDHLAVGAVQSGAVSSAGDTDGLDHSAIRTGLSEVCGHRSAAVVNDKGVLTERDVGRGRGRRRERRKGKRERETKRKWKMEEGRRTGRDNSFLSVAYFCLLRV